MRKLRAPLGILFLLAAPACGSAPNEISTQSSDLIEGVSPAELWQSRSIMYCFQVPELTKMPADVRAVVFTQADLLKRFRSRTAEFVWAISNTWHALGVISFSAYEGCGPNMVPINYNTDLPTGGNAALGRVGGLSVGINMDAKFLANTYATGVNTYHTFVAAHEFGHTLGFRHEQDRTDSPCHVSKDFTGVGIDLTDYDAQSIMNYCDAQHTQLTWFDQVGYRRVYESLYLGGGACTDSNVSCNGWAQTGECGKNPSYMLTNCCASCTSESPCNDHDSRCNGWAASGECSKNPNYMLTSCCASCVG